MDKFKSLLPYLGAVLFFIALAALYFWPVIEGKALPQMDNTHSVGMAQELNELEAETGKRPNGLTQCLEECRLIKSRLTLRRIYFPISTAIRVWVCPTIPSQFSFSTWQVFL